MLYGDDDGDGAVTLSSGKDGKGLDAAFRQAADIIRRAGGFNTAQLSTPQVRAVIGETARILSQAIGSSLPHETPDALRYALENNAFVFSGFKTYHSLREVGLSLTDSNGNIKPFEQFRKDVQRISTAYNRNYLYAEYNHAVAASQMAEKWQRWEKDGDRYDLQYRTAGDDRVREAHRLLYGTTLPPSDPFWEQYLPPNGWNCRCTAVQVRKGKYPQSDPALALQRGNACTASLAQQVFRYNPGKTLELFPPKHPYYKVPEEAKDVIQKAAHIEQSRREYERLKDDPDYRDVHFDPKTGGVKATHKGHITHDDENAPTFFGNMKPTDLEKACQKFLYGWGHRAILRDEHANSKAAQRLPALDLELDGRIMDIRSITTSEYYGYALMAKNHHLGNVKKRTGLVSDCVCLYFHEKTLFSDEKMLNDIEWYKSHVIEVGSKQRIHHIYVVVRGEQQLRVYDI